MSERTPPNLRVDGAALPWRDTPCAGPGRYVWHPPGSVHAPRSATGCVVFVVLLAPIEVLGA